jgi:hypothetical protein
MWVACWCPSRHWNLPILWNIVWDTGCLEVLHAFSYSFQANSKLVELTLLSAAFKFYYLVSPHDKTLHNLVTDSAIEITTKSVNCVNFWVFPRRLVYIGRRFGSLCQVHLQRFEGESLKSRTKSIINTHVVDGIYHIWFIHLSVYKIYVY